jgi:hypothetical protein
MPPEFLAELLARDTSTNASSDAMTMTLLSTDVAVGKKLKSL